MTLTIADLRRIRAESKSREKEALRANSVALLIALLRLDFKAFDRLASHREAFRKDAARAAGAPAYCPAILED